MNILDRFLLWFCDKQLTRLSKKIGEKVIVTTYNQTRKTGLNIGSYCHKLKHRAPELN